MVYALLEFCFGFGFCWDVGFDELFACWLPWVGELFVRCWWDCELFGCFTCVFACGLFVWFWFWCFIGGLCFLIVLGLFWMFVFVSACCGFWLLCCLCLWFCLVDCFVWFVVVLIVGCCFICGLGFCLLDDCVVWWFIVWWSNCVLVRLGVGFGLLCLIYCFGIRYFVLFWFWLILHWMLVVCCVLVLFVCLFVDWTCWFYGWYFVFVDLGVLGCFCWLLWTWRLLCLIVFDCVMLGFGWLLLLFACGGLVVCRCFDCVIMMLFWLFDGCWCRLVGVWLIYFAILLVWVGVTFCVWLLWFVFCLLLCCLVSFVDFWLLMLGF